MSESDISSGAGKIHGYHFTSSNHAIQATRQVQSTFMGLESSLSDQAVPLSFILCSFLKMELVAATMTHSQITDVFTARTRVLIPNPYHSYCLMVRLCRPLVFRPSCTFPLRFMSRSSKSQSVGTIMNYESGTAAENRSLVIRAKTDHDLIRLPVHMTSANVTRLYVHTPALHPKCTAIAAGYEWETVYHPRRESQKTHC
jgi:hypothetical protein